MRLIRLVFWLGVSVILAYFMTDIRVGGITIKEKIDRVIGPGRVQGAFKQVKNWIFEKVGGLDYEPPLRQAAPEAGKNEEITDRDSEELKKVIQENQ